MISDFFLIIMTENLSQQLNFYKDFLKLDLLFDNNNVVGLGKDKRLFLLIREDKVENSHHLAEHKGPQILTFRCQGDMQQFIEKTKKWNFKVRDTLTIPEYNRQFLFIEDYDGNEICLDFTPSHEF